MTVLSNIGSLVTCTGTPADPGVIRDAAVVFHGGRILWVGPRAELAAGSPAEAWEDVWDAGGRLVVPGLIDCHTHAVFGGWRADEFERRLRGESYHAIAASGGGILSTVRRTLELDADALRARSQAFIDSMVSLGVTTVEVKSGYGLDVDAELRLLEVIRRLRGPTVVATLLAHVVPPGERAAGAREGYVRRFCDELIPRAVRGRLADACDVYVDDGAFLEAEARAIAAAAAGAGLPLRLHVDQHRDGGGAALAAALGASSADHLEHVGPAGIEALARAGTVAVTLPLAAMYLGGPWAPARALLDAGVSVAVATDFNPGTAPSFHLPLAMTLACTQQRMTPAEALWGVTRAAARALGLEHSHGHLARGAVSDLAVIDADSVAQWLYHFTASASVWTIAGGQSLWRRE